MSKRMSDERLEQIACGHFLPSHFDRELVAEVRAERARVNELQEENTQLKETVRQLHSNFLQASKETITAEAKVARVEEMCKSDPRLFFTSTQIQAALQEPSAHDRIAQLEDVFLKAALQEPEQ